MIDRTQEGKAATPSEQLHLLEDEEPVTPPTPLERMLKALKLPFQAAKRPSSTTRTELGKDKSKSFFILAAAAVLALLVFLALFSSPQKPKRRDASSKGKPDLGRRVTPGQEQREAGSTTPLLSADTREENPSTGDQVTPDDINRTSHAGVQSAVAKPNTTASTLIPPAPAAHADPKTKNRLGQKYELGQIDFSDPDLQKEYAKAGFGGNQNLPATSHGFPTPLASENDLKKPSLVFVRNTEASAGLASAVSHANGERFGDDKSFAEATLLDSLLPPGTRLVARLESAASTAVSAPVVAAIEYNYERDGEIVIPAGSKVLGRLLQANSSGFVSLHFDTIELPDGNTEKIDGTSMGLDFAPLKGQVAGKKRGTRFLVQTLTGLGTAAAYLVGANNINGPISGSVLLRERMADNVGIAGQNELNQVAFNQNIAVTVPGNTRFYVVLQKTTDDAGKARSSGHVNDASRAASDGQDAPSLQELRQLLQLKQELSQLTQQEPTEKSASSDNQQQQ